MKIIELLLILFAMAGSLHSQDLRDSWCTNRITLQVNNHLEKRGTDRYETSNPDVIVSYERDLFTFARHHLGVGLRTGAYWEYVLTGNGWDHPVKSRVFLGLTPVYSWQLNQHIWLQLNLLYDVLFPDDYDEIWSYWAVEPSIQYRRGIFYAGLSATNGVFLYFDPRAHFAKAGIKVGVCF